MEITYRSPFGTITRTETDPLVVDGRQVDCWLTTYRPPPALIRDVPEGGAITFLCYEDDDHVRRFIPADGYEVFIRDGFRIGLAIIAREYRLDAADRQSYRAMYQAFDLVRGLGEHATVKFNFSRSLFISRGGRASDGRTNILPECLFSLDLREIRTIRDVVQVGEQLAEERGIIEPTRRVAIQHALFEAAQNDPLIDQSEEQIEALVRGALFTDTQRDDLDPDLIEDVTERWLVAMQRHADDDHRSFANWFNRRAANWMRNIANQKKGRLGVLTQNQVRAVMLEIGWGAYRYVTNCLGQLGRYFIAAQQLKLTHAEEKWFKQVYFPQRHYANLPLILILERGVVGLAAARLLEQPNDRHMIGVLHRLLKYDVAMVAMRKRADQQVKSPRSPAHAGCLLSEPMDPEHRSVCRPSEDRDQFDAVASLLAKQRGHQCARCNFALEYCLFDEDPTALTIRQRCLCGRNLDFVVTPGEYRSAALQIVDEMRESELRTASR